MKRIKARESGATDQVLPFGCSVEVVSDATCEHERCAVINDAYRVRGSSWRTVCRQRIANIPIFGERLSIY